MKYMIQILFLFFSISAQSSELVALSDLTSLQWSKRIVVVNNVQHVERLLTLLEKNTRKIDDRDIVWLVIKENHTFTNYSGELSEDLLSNTVSRYKVEQGKVVMIGKDGGVKSQFERVDLEDIFSEIDAMPMRQSEMRN